MASVPRTKQPPDIVSTVERKQEPELLDITIESGKKTVKYELVPVPPDGGYGWVIVAAVASLSFISLWYVYILGNLHRLTKYLTYRRKKFLNIGHFVAVD